MPWALKKNNQNNNKQKEKKQSRRWELAGQKSTYTVCEKPWRSSSRICSCWRDNFFILWWCDVYFRYYQRCFQPCHMFSLAPIYFPEERVITTLKWLFIEKLVNFSFFYLSILSTSTNLLHQGTFCGDVLSHAIVTMTWLSEDAVFYHLLPKQKSLEGWVQSLQ